MVRLSLESRMAGNCYPTWLMSGEAGLVGASEVVGGDLIMEGAVAAEGVLVEESLAVVEGTLEEGISVEDVG
jgi:hypothetical protein